MSDLDAGKRTFRLEVSGDGAGPDTFVPIGVIEGSTAGPRAAVVAGVHGTELVTQDAVQALWQQLSSGQVHGSLTFIFVADILAARAGIPGANPVDGRNLNRVWPGSADGTFSERLAARLWSELLGQPDVVIDVHGGEWTEEVHPFALVHPSGDAERDRRALQLAAAMGLPYVQSTVGEGTLSGAVIRSGRIGLAFEVGGGGQRPKADVERVVRAIRGALAAAGSIEKQLAVETEPTVVLAGGEHIRSTVGGVLLQEVELGQAVELGQRICTLTDFNGDVLETISAPRSGLILLRSLARVIAEGGLVASIGWSED
ncbi:MAG: succinylglutamate desuccinylase/aspartoacylase family protein [Candidatus Dormiibacterota bacterium]